MRPRMVCLFYIKQKEFLPSSSSYESLEWLFFLPLFLVLFFFLWLVFLGVWTFICDLTVLFFAFYSGVIFPGEHFVTSISDEENSFPPLIA